MQFLLSIILRIVSITIEGKLIIAATNDNKRTKEKEKKSKRTVDMAECGVSTISC